MSEWLKWRPRIAKAASGSHHTIESIERDLADGRTHLLTMPDCCFIVEIMDYPAERACQVMWCAGELEAVLEAEPRLCAWAKAQGCTEILSEGRAGWSRVFREHGYRPWSVTVRKAL